MYCKHLTGKFLKTELSPADFQKTLLTYDDLVLGRRRRDKAIVAMTVFGAEIDVVDGKQYNLLRIGLAFVDEEYQSGIFFPVVTAYASLRELLLHPDIPLYNVAKCFTYKSYLGAMRQDRAYPRYNKVTPDWERKIIIKYGKRYETETAKFCEETFVVKRQHTKVQDNIADISHKHMANPHIKFYCSQNPGWTKGHSLITIALCTWNDVGESFKKAVTRSQYQQSSLLRSHL
ncbi:uncharacterized protein [Dysidea avara]|uniref:uncharacterized protein n=1 Tax=Dysidea avara TaxID=196820 RepID=UPI0033186D02